MEQQPSAVQEWNDSYRTFSGCDMVCTVNYKTAEGYFVAPVVLGSLQTLSYSIHQDKSPVRAIGDMNIRDYVFGPRTIAGSLVFAVFNKHWAMDMMEAYAGQSGIEATHFLVDEIPPFDITVTFANEYGKSARMALYGVRIIDEGMVLSINDFYTENTYQFVAANIDYMADAAHSEKNQTNLPPSTEAPAPAVTDSGFSDALAEGEPTGQAQSKIPEDLTGCYDGEDKNECLRAIESARAAEKARLQAMYDSGAFTTEREYRQAAGLAEIKCNRLVKAAMQKYDA